MKPDCVMWYRFEVGGTRIGSNYPDAVGSAEFKNKAGAEYTAHKFSDGTVMVSEPLVDRAGELIHQTYWLNDILALACFLSDKEQLHGQAGTGEQAAHRGLPGTGNDPRPGQGN